MIKGATVIPITTIRRLSIMVRIIKVKIGRLMPTIGSRELPKIKKIMSGKICGSSRRTLSRAQNPFWSRSGSGSKSTLSLKKSFQLITKKKMPYKMGRKTTKKLKIMTIKKLKIKKIKSKRNEHKNVNTEVNNQ